MTLHYNYRVLSAALADALEASPDVSQAYMISDDNEGDFLLAEIRGVTFAAPFYPATEAALLSALSTIIDQARGISRT